jgi:predicted ATPase/class 3 adenylate cyclase
MWQPTALPDAVYAIIAPGAHAMGTTPSGTVTFLFTDIEGSTRRWDEQPDAMKHALARHDALLRECIERHGGHVFKTVGDAFHAAFATAPAALRAAVEGQRALTAEGWGEAVRMALHTGSADERDGDYFGPPLNRVARLLEAGHGGQVLLSAVAAGLMRGQIPDGVELRDLGVHRLRDLAAPEHIHQAAIWGLPADFPPLRTDDERPTNLPTSLTSFVGRERDVADVIRLLEMARLVTLTGPGGTGKTRLALAVVERVQPAYADGISFVDLSALADAGLVASTIAQALGLRETEGQPPAETLRAYLRDKQTLLVLDNFEQVVAAAPLLRDLIAACPPVRLLVTSRVVLHIPGEREYAVPPLPLPDPHGPSTPAGLARSPAVALFVDRAQGVRPAFALTEDNAGAVAEVCRRLDGLPLAIELAAARAKILTPHALLARLGGAHGRAPLQLLTGGAPVLPQRQQTLRATIQWSYDLLDERERALFRRLSVFAGGCMIEAAEAVCDAGGDLGLDILDGLASLVDNSLLREVDAPDGEPRFSMYAVIREFAAEQLAAAAERSDLAERHARVTLAMVRHAAGELRGPTASAAEERLVAEQDNIRAALAWCVEADDAALGSRLVWSLTYFWVRRWLGREGRSWCERLLALPSAQARTMSRARILLAAADQTVPTADNETLLRYADECVAISREIGDIPCLAHALRFAGIARLRRGDPAAARASFEEALTLLRGIGDRSVALAVMQSLGAISAQIGDREAARTLREDALAEARRIGDHWILAQGLIAIAFATEADGDDARAWALYEEAMRLFPAAREGGAPLGVRLGLARLALRRGDEAHAAGLIRGCLAQAGAQGATAAALDAVEDAARLVLWRGDPLAAARLAGVAAAERERSGTLRPSVLRAGHDAVLAAMRDALGEEAFTAAWTEGRALSLDAAVALALEQTAPT